MVAYYQSLAVRGGLPADRVELRKFVFEAEAAGTLFEGRALHAGTATAQSFSDLLRFVVLVSHALRRLPPPRLTRPPPTLQSKYGGVYFDADIVLLRDLRPLLGMPFVEWWGEHAYFNTCVFHLPRGSAAAAKLVRRAIGSKATLKASAFHPRVVTDHAKALRLYPKQVLVLSNAFFDPGWCGTQENKKGVLVGRTYPYFKSFVQRPADAGYARKLMAAGAFAYHYHLSSSAPKAGVHSLFDAFWEVMGGGDHASGGNATGPGDGDY